MKTTRLPACVCASCGADNDAATDPLREFAPMPGDVSICLKCGHLGIFDGEMQVRDPTSEEMYELAGHPEILRMQAARAKVKL